MYRSNRLEGSGELGWETAFSAPSSSHHPYNSIQSTTDDGRNGYPRSEQFACASIYPPYGYTNSQESNVSFNLSRSTGLESDYPVSSTGFGPGLTTLGQVINGGFDVSKCSHCMVPSGNQSILPGPFRNEVEDFETTPCFPAVDTFASNFNQHGHFAPNQTVQTESRGFHDINSTGILNDDLQMHSSESFFFGQAGQWSKPSNNGLQQKIDADFGISDSQCALDKSTLPLAIDMQPCYQDTVWCVPSSSSYGLDELFQSHFDSDLTHRDRAGFSSRIAEDDEPPDDRFVNLDYSHAAKRDSNALESVVDTPLSSKRARIMTGYRKIVPKTYECSTQVIESADRNSVVRRGVKKGGRQGHLSPEKRQKATEMRDLRACVSCFISHVECSKHLVCERCRKRDEKNAINSPGCLRGPLQVFTELLSPSLLTGHTTPWYLDGWIRENNILFTSNQTLVQVSSDPFDIPMPLVVHEISSLDQSCLLVPDLIGQQENETQSFSTRSTLPYGYSKDMAQLQRRCLEYVNKVSRYPLEMSEPIAGDTSGIIWDVLTAVCDFERANQTARKEGVLLKAINVFWMDYMMNRNFVFTKDSAVKAIHSLQHPSTVLPDELFISAALLNRQIKVAINLLLDEYIRELFDKVEKKLRSNRACFAICFCINLILCILVEQIEIAIDAIVVGKISSGQDEGSVRKEGIQICEALEKLPMIYSWTLFEGVQRKYNPIQKGCMGDNGSGQNQGEQQLVDSIRQLMHTYDEDISRKVADSSCLGGSSESPAEHERFRERNSGRHVSRFLRKFC